MRLAGLRGQPSLNGKEGILGPFDVPSGRWVFRDGPTCLRIKAECLEIIGKRPKTRLASEFFDRAREFQYEDLYRNDFVFNRMYDMAAADGQPGVGAFFDQVLADETVFTTIYCRLAG